MALTRQGRLRVKILHSFTLNPTYKSYISHPSAPQSADADASSATSLARRAPAWQPEEGPRDQLLNGASSGGAINQGLTCGQPLIMPMLFRPAGTPFYPLFFFENE